MYIDTVFRFYGYFFSFYLSLLLSCMFEHDCLDTCCFGCLNACVVYFCIYTCSAQLRMFHMERRSRNTLIIIISDQSLTLTAAVEQLSSQGS